MAFRRTSRALTAVVLGLALGVTGAQSAQAAPASKCSADQVFIGVRGSDAPAGSGSEEGGRVYASGGFGDQIAALAPSFNADVFSTWARAIRYDARGGTEYWPSQLDGEQKLVTVLNSLADCGGQMPLIFLAGHSQGADVVLEALANSQLLKSVWVNIKAVAVFGDPKFRSGMNFNFSPPPGGQGILGARTTGLTNVLESRYWFYGYPQWADHPMWSSRIRSWCYPNDWACQSLALNSSTNASHNNYAQHMPDVFSWMMHMGEWT